MDSYKHQGMRKLLVQELREKGISDERVLSAIMEIPRHKFLDTAFLKQAYSDMAFQIGAGQTISHPYTVAFQSSLLQLKKGDKVLEIGTGSGYQTAVLMQMQAKVFTIERQKILFDRTKKVLPELGFLPRFFYGDGYKGLPSYAPFDKIIVTAGAPFIPEPLKEQLKVGGILVIPVGDNNVQRMYSVIKIDEQNYDIIEHGDFKFVPMLTDKVD